jgi:hypothetical protein
VQTGSALLAREYLVRCRLFEVGENGAPRPDATFEIRLQIRVQYVIRRAEDFLESARKLLIVISHVSSPKEQKNLNKEAPLARGFGRVRLIMRNAPSPWSGKTTNRPDTNCSWRRV